MVPLVMWTCIRHHPTENSNQVLPHHNNSELPGRTFLQNMNTTTGNLSTTTHQTARNMYATGANQTHYSVDGNDFNISYTPALSQV